MRISCNICVVQEDAFQKKFESAVLYLYNFSFVFFTFYCPFQYSNKTQLNPFLLYLYIVIIILNYEINQIEQING